MRRGISSIALACALVIVSNAHAQQRESVEARLKDGSLLACVTERGIVAGVSEDGTPWVHDVFDLQPGRAEFRVLYRPTVDGSSSQIWIDERGGLGAIPRLDQERFPESVRLASLTFIRTTPENFVIIQFDPWEGDELSFTWVERRTQRGGSEVAHGTCRLVHQVSPGLIRLRLPRSADGPHRLPQRLPWQRIG